MFGAQMPRASNGHVTQTFRVAASHYRFTVYGYMVYSKNEQMDNKHVTYMKSPDPTP